MGFAARAGSLLSEVPRDFDSHRCRYAMMIAAQRDNATMFDQLWRWAKTHMRHNELDDARHGYFAWHCSPAGQQLDSNPASDGETWIAAALYTAAARWERADYAAEATALLQDCTNKTGKIESVTSMFNNHTGVAEADSQVVFTPYANSASFTDPSYHLPAFYWLWAQRAAAPPLTMAAPTFGARHDYEQLSTTCQHASSIGGGSRVSSIAECEAACDARAGCVAVDTDGTTCYLKAHCEGEVGECSEWCGFRQTGGPTPPSPPMPPGPGPGPTPLPTPPASAAFWKGFVRSSRTFFPLASSPQSSLAPDYATFAGAPTGSQQHFAFDAWRVAQNVAMDYAWLAADAAEVSHCERLHAFFKQANASKPYGNQFDVASGRQLSADHSPGLVAMNAVCSLASNATLAWDFVAELWTTPTPTGKYRYYDGMLYMLGWLQLSGQFRYYPEPSKPDDM